LKEKEEESETAVKTKKIMKDITPPNGLPIATSLNGGIVPIEKPPQRKRSTAEEEYETCKPGCFSCGS